MHPQRKWVPKTLRTTHCTARELSFRLCDEERHSVVVRMEIESNCTIFAGTRVLENILVAYDWRQWWKWKARSCVFFHGNLSSWSFPRKPGEVVSINVTANFQEEALWETASVARRNYLRFSVRFNGGRIESFGKWSPCVLWTEL